MTLSQQAHEAAKQAAVWRARLSSDLITETGKREFKRWLAARPENRKAWREINAFWLGLDAVSEAEISEGTELPRPGSGTNAALAASTHPAEASPGNKGLSKPALAIAASFLLAVSILFSRAELWLADYKTAPGELRTLQLSDGSTITLNSDSALSVDYSDAQRLITLYEGEVYVVAAADPSRPFIVTAETGRVRALGTQFNIKSRGQGVEVTVFEHAVSVTLENGEVVERLAEGQQLAFDDGHIAPPAAADLTKSRSWRDRQMIFQDKPLAEVIAELNHYRSGMIVVLGDEIGQLPVTGVFATDNTDVALKTIEQSLPVRVTKIADAMVLLSTK